MSEKLFACLLRLYPSAFRTRYYEEALLLYRDRLRDEPGVLQRCRLSSDMLLDALLGLTQAWRNTYSATNAPPFAPAAEGTPSFHLLDNQPLRPASIFIGGTLSFAALSALGLVMSLPTPFQPSSISKRHSSPIESVMKRLNRATTPGNDSQSTTANASAAEGALQGQSQADTVTAVLAGSGAMLDAAERDRVIRAVAGILVSHYVDPQKAREASDLILAREKRGRYDAVGDGLALAQRLTQDIQSSTQDSRVAVQFNRIAIPSPPPSSSDAQRERYRAAMLRQNCTIEKVQVLPNRIGYIKFNFFPEASVCGSMFQASMKQLNPSESIVIDLRDNSGGFPEMVADVAAELFDYPVLWYNPRETPNATMLTPARGSKLGSKPVYILTSSHTFSGAEHFAYDLKMLKRATVIGETTRGGHPGAAYRIDDHFWMTVPEVRMPSPYGTLDWDGSGVEPDVKVSAADALAVAEKLALERHKK